MSFQSKYTGAEVEQRLDMVMTLSESVGGINTSLNRVFTDLESLTSKNLEQDNRLTELETLVNNGGTGGGGEVDHTLLQKVEDNAQAISELKAVVGDNSSGLVKDVSTLLADDTTEGSVDYKIAQALVWVDINTKEQ